MKSSILLILAIFIFSGFIPKENNINYLEWNEFSRLQWEDFQGQVAVSAFGDASIAVSITAKPYYKKNRKIVYDVNAYFLRDKSWCRHKSENLLAHEQLHFDLAELYARKVRKKISEYQQMGIRDVHEYNTAIKKILEESNRIDSRYDAETLHGALPKKQAAWNKEIHDDLTSLSKFSKTNWQRYHR